MNLQSLLVGVLLLGVLVAGLAVFASGSKYNPLTVLSSVFGPKHQGIEGSATMTFWAISCSATPNTEGPSLNISSIDGTTTQRPLSWSIFQDRLGCVHQSFFRIEMRPGTYSITLALLTASQCHKPQQGFGGLTCNLPYQVDVEPGRYPTVSVYITGGL